MKMAWITAIAKAILGLLQSLPTIIQKIEEWRASEKIKRQQALKVKLDQVENETKQADTDDKRKTVARKWSDIIRNMHK